MFGPFLSPDHVGLVFLGDPIEFGEESLFAEKIIRIDEPGIPAAGSPNTGVAGRALAGVCRKLDVLDAGIFSGNPADDFHRTIGGGIIHDDDRYIR